MFSEVIRLLKDMGRSVSAMESCTGGGVSNSITNVSGASDVFSFGCVTYSNEYKIKMCVDKDIIDKYSVYSVEVAREMSRAISQFTGSTYGIGITGKLNKSDKNNLYGKDNVVFIGIYDSISKNYVTSSIEVYKDSRELNKELVLEKVRDMMLELLKNK